MPRIRSLKPESLQHRKVGRLSDRAFRLWVGMVTHADDAGRIVCDPEQFRVLFFGYQKTTTKQVGEALEELKQTEMIRVCCGCACFPSWKDHQKISHPTPSKLEPCEHFQKLLEISGTLQNLPQRSDLIRSDLKGSDLSNTSPRSEELRSLADSSNEWGSPESLVSMYNELTPEEFPSVEKISPGRISKCKSYLTAFPDKEFWVTVFKNCHCQFLRGLRPSNGHEKFTGDLDWLLSKGKDGTENCVKVHDGKYLDKGK